MGGTLFFSHQRLLVAKKEREVTVTIQSHRHFLSVEEKKTTLAISCIISALLWGPNVNDHKRDERFKKGELFV